jgi:hypothetical protein
VVALWRGGELVERHIGEEPLHQGDAFLVQGLWRKIRLLHEQPGLLVISVDEYMRAVLKAAREGDLTLKLLEPATESR